MKKIFFSILIGFFLFTPTTNAQKVVVKHRNKVVKVRPNKPKIVIVKPNKVKRNYIWVPGHWKWSLRKGRYVWIKGKWKKRKDIVNGYRNPKSSRRFIWIDGIGQNKLLKNYVDKLFF